MPYGWRGADQLWNCGGKYEYMVGRDQWNTCVYSCKYYGTCTTYKSPDEEARNYHMQKKSENVYCYLGCSTTVSKWLQQKKSGSADQ